MKTCSCLAVKPPRVSHPSRNVSNSISLSCLRTRSLQISSPRLGTVERSSHPSRLPQFFRIIDTVVRYLWKMRRAQTSVGSTPSPWCYPIFLLRLFRHNGLGQIDKVPCNWFETGHSCCVFPVHLCAPSAPAFLPTALSVPSENLCHLWRTHKQLRSIPPRTASFTNSQYSWA